MKLKKEKYKISDIIAIPLKSSPLYASMLMVQRIINGIVPTLQLLALAEFINKATEVVKGNTKINEVILPIIFVALLMSYDWISEKISDFPNVKLQLKLRENFRVLIVEKTAKLKYRHIENADTWDLISRVSKDPEIKILEAYTDLLDMLAMLIRIIGLLGILFIKIWWAPIVIILICIPLFKISFKGGKETYDAEREVSKYERKYEYLGEVLKGREAVDERTMFGYSDSINEKWWQQYEKARKIKFKVKLKWFIRMKAGGVLTATISIIIALILAKPTIEGKLDIGMFISIINGVFELIQMMSWQITYCIDQLANYKEYLKDLTNFSTLEENEGALDLPSKENLKLNTLEFKNVSFKYPGTENYILKNLSFKIEKGKHYALVGTNGSGKTTITKLITGLYHEYEGHILINNVDIKDLRESQLKSLSSVVYQDFAKYYISLKDNIALGDVLNMGNESQNKEIENAIRVIDLEETIKELPRGIENNLGKIMEDGQDLSGGQWQRIGMARCIISNSELRILDEPTAALDPISESNIYEEFEQISKGGTTIFISHRLGSTKLADEIFVLDNGKIIEKGSFEELMKINGVYANMYESQRSWYL